MASLPSHLLVQKQLQDLVLMQQHSCDRLRDDMSQSMSSKNNDFVPKTLYDEVLKEIKLLKESMRTTFVPKSQYHALEHILEQEQIEHAATKRRVMELEDKFEFAHGEIEILNKQLSREKQQFEKMCGTLKTKALVQTTKNMALEKVYTVTDEHCKKQENILLGQETEIKMLGHKLKSQEEDYQKQLSEVKVKLQQERYIQNMLKDADKPHYKHKMRYSSAETCPSCVAKEKGVCILHGLNVKSRKRCRGEGRNLNSQLMQ